MKTCGRNVFVFVCGAAAVMLLAGAAYLGNLAAGRRDAAIRRRNRWRAGGVM